MSRVLGFMDLGLEESREEIAPITVRPWTNDPRLIEVVAFCAIGHGQKHRGKLSFVVDRKLALSLADKLIKAIAEAEE